MASEQMVRRDNTTTERDIEKNRVPKMTTHFEHLPVQAKESDIAGGKETPQGIQELQGGEHRRDQAGKAIGDVRGRGNARETHELGTHFESIADKVKGETEGEKEKEKQRMSNADNARTENIVRDKEAEARKERERGGVHVPSDVGKFQMKTEEKGAGEVRSRGRAEHEAQTEMATGRLESTEERKRRDIREKASEGEKGRGTTGVKVRLEEGVDEKGRGRETRAETGEEKLGRGVESRVEALGRGTGAETQGATTVITCTVEGGEQQRGRGRDSREETGEEKTRGNESRGEKQGATLEEISKYRDQVQQNSMDAIRGAQERYERAKQAASETLGATTQTAQEKGAQAREIAAEKATQAKEMANQAIGTTTQKGAQARDIAMAKASQAKEMAAQAKDVTLEKSQQGYVAAKDTISGATKTAKDYTVPVAEKAKDYTVQAAEMAKSAGGTTVQYVADKAVQAKDVTVETGKTAAEYAGKVAEDLKDKAGVAGWTAAHYSTDKTVEGTKAAANVVQGAAGYAGHKATEIASKSLGAVKNLAATAGETAKDYTARKKGEAERELEAKKAAQYQETEERPSEKITGESFQTGQEHGEGGREGGECFQGRQPTVSQRSTQPYEAIIGERFQGGQERVKERKEGGIGDTVGQQAQRTQPTGESLQRGQVQGHQEGMAASFQTGQEHGKGGRGGGESFQGRQPTVSQWSTQPYEAVTGERFLEGQDGIRQRKEGGIGETVGQHAQITQPTGESLQRGQAQGHQEGTGRHILTAIGGTAGHTQRTQKPPENITGESIQKGHEQDQVRKERGVGETGGQYTQRIKPSDQSFQRDQVQGQEGKGSEVLSTIGEKGSEVMTTMGEKGSEALSTIGHTVGDVAQMMKKPLDNITEGRNVALGAVGETVGEIGETMIKPADKVLESQEEKESGVLGAIGETIAEIAETTKNIVVGEGETESKQSIGSESRTAGHGNQGELKQEEGRKTGSFVADQRETTRKTMS